MPRRSSRNREPSALCQVVEWLQRQPVGTVLLARHAHAALPHLNPTHVSAALSVLASAHYAVLTKLPRDGRLQPYRVTSLSRTEWNGHAAPQYAGRTRPPRTQREVDAAARAKVSELLVTAAVMTEDGAKVDEVLQTIRAAYYELKGRR